MTPEDRRLKWPLLPVDEFDWWMFAAIVVAVLLFVHGSSCEIRFHVESRPSTEVHP